MPCFRVPFSWGAIRIEKIRIGESASSLVFIPEYIKGGGSIGRAAVSNTAGCRFESCPPCTVKGEKTMAQIAAEEPGEDVVARAKEESATKRNVFARIALFLRQVMQELRKVVTPTRKELLSYTGVVLVFVIIMMALVSGMDWIFGWVVVVVFGTPAA
jgi:preprotein translocase subunit SecE